MIIIICDATKDIGYGHLKRCLALAFFYRKLGIPVTFLMRTALPVVKNILHRHDMGLVVRPDHEECWSYLFEKQDQIKIVIIDHYEIGADLENNIFGVFPILVIDDLCRPHWCDLLVDQTINRKEHHYYKKLYNALTQTLPGIKYTLIDPVYQEITTNKDKRNILITFGATDPGKASLKVLEILENTMGKKEVVFHVPLSSMSPCLEPLKKFIHKSWMDIRLYQDLPDLCSLYKRCGIAIGAPGTSMLERIYCNLINITIVVADNQREVGQNLARKGVIASLGDINNLDPLMITNKVIQMIDSPAYCDEMQKRAEGLVDGKGPVRIIKQTIKFISPVRLRPADKSDMEILYKWQHAKDARKYFRNPNPPNREEHQVWFDNVFKNDDVKIFIMEWCNMEIGYIRLNNNEKTKEVSILIAQNFQCFGFARTALLEIIKTKKQVFTAFIHPENKASIGLFTSVGFQSAGKGDYIYNAAS